MAVGVSSFHALHSLLYCRLTWTWLLFTVVFSWSFGKSSAPVWGGWGILPSFIGHQGRHSLRRSCIAIVFKRLYSLNYVPFGFWLFFFFESPDCYYWYLTSSTNWKLSFPCCYFWFAVSISCPHCVCFVLCLWAVGNHSRQSRM